MSRTLLCASLLRAAVAAAALDIDAGSLRARLEAHPWRLVARDREGGTLLAERADTGPGPSGTLGFRTPAGWAHATRLLGSRRGRRGVDVALETTDAGGRRLKVRVAVAGEGIVRIEARVGGDGSDIQAVGIGWDAAADERFYGLGERADAVEHRGRTVESYVSDGPYQADERSLVALFVPPPGFRSRDDATYFPMPWVLSSRGYGVLVDNDEVVYHRFGTDRSDAWSLEVTGAPEGEPARPAPTTLRLRLIAGPRPADVLRRFTAALGRQPPAAAPWIFGPWFQPGGSLDEQVGQIRRLRAAGAPVSVAQTYLHYLPCGDQLGREDAERERTAALHAEGVAVTTYFNPMICRDYEPRFGEAVAAGALVRDPTGAPYVYPYTGSRIFQVGQFDFARRAGRIEYARLLREAIEHGHDGWMEDFGEYTPLDARAGGQNATGAALHDRYVVDYHCAAYATARRAPRPVVRFQRSGWTGAARCAQVVWGGDPSTDFGFDGLTSAVRSGLGMGLSGVSTWGSDIGGFFALGDRTLTDELLARWVQVGAFSGVMRMERTGFALPPKPRPQVEDDGQIANWRRYARLRTQLYPYLAAADAEYRRTGMPIMRHLVLVFPNDAAAAGRDDEFLFGPDLLVAPVLAPGAVEREVYLPAGSWIDFWRTVELADDGPELRPAVVLEGARAAMVPAPADEIPLLVRAGAILPLLPADVATLADYGTAPGLVHLADRDDTLVVLAFPRGRSAARFRKRGRISSAAAAASWTVDFRGDGVRRYDLRASLTTLAQPLVPCSVVWNRRALPAETWTYDAATGELKVMLAGGRGRLVVRSTCSGR